MTVTVLVYNFVNNLIREEILELSKSKAQLFNVTCGKWWLLE